MDSREKMKQATRETEFFDVLSFLHSQEEEEDENRQENKLLLRACEEQWLLFVCVCMFGLIKL